MKKIILVQDIKAILEEDRSFFNRAGIKAIAATSNEDILALHRAEKADLIITNLDTPRMNAETLCSLIRDDEGLRNVSIIIVCPETAANLQRCAKCRANAFLTSPINHAVLLQEAYQLLHITPRKSCRVSLKLKVEGKSKEKAFSGHTENISTSGMLFQSAAMLFEGDTMHCSFSLPGLRHISASAEIVRALPKEKGPDAINRYGVIFSDINDNDISAIEAFVRSNSGTLTPIS